MCVDVDLNIVVNARIIIDWCHASNNVCVHINLPNQSTWFGVLVAFPRFAVAVIENSEPVKLRIMLFVRRKQCGRNVNWPKKKNYKKITTGTKNDKTWCNDFLVELNLICFVYFVAKKLLTFARVRMSSGDSVRWNENIAWPRACSHIPSLKEHFFGQIKINRISYSNTPLNGHPSRKLRWGQKMGTFDKQPPNKCRLRNQSFVIEFNFIR